MSVADVAPNPASAREAGMSSVRRHLRDGHELLEEHGVIVVRA